MEVDNEDEMPVDDESEHEDDETNTREIGGLRCVPPSLWMSTLDKHIMC